MTAGCPKCGYQFPNVALTKQQKRLLDYITKYRKEKGITPSYEEMRKAFKLASRSGIHRLVVLLEQRGAIVRRREIARTIIPTTELRA